MLRTLSGQTELCSLFSREGIQPGEDLISNSSKGIEALLLRAGNGGRIVEAPVHALGVARKNRTTFLRVITDCDDVIERLI